MFSYENIGRLRGLEDNVTFLSSDEAVAALVATIISLESIVPGTAENILIKLALIDGGFTSSMSIKPELAPAVVKAEKEFVEYLAHIMSEIGQ
jgi:hypothetical protein